jgi:peptidyl-prolyl cis-trans isomerase C
MPEHLLKKTSLDCLLFLTAGRHLPLYKQLRKTLMKYFSHGLILLLLLSPLQVSCSSENAETAADAGVAETSGANAGEGDTSTVVIATVNGSPISQEMYDVYASKRSAQTEAGAPAPDRDTVLNELINVELVMQDAVNKGIDKRPEIEEQMAWQRRSLLVTAGMRDYLSANPITDADLKKVYDQEVAGMDKTEYKARHILVKTEDEAKEIIKSLDGGADFAELAKEKSTGPTGKNGGDLGWFSPGTMVKPFSEAAAGMEKGTYSKTPVQTQFGWHVILLEDKRDMTAPPFEQVKTQLQPKVQKARIDAYIKELRQNAKIDIQK